MDRIEAGAYVQSYDSVEELTVAADKALKEGREVHFESEHFIGRKGLKRWKDAVGCVQEPWTDGLDNIQEMLHLIRTEVAELRPRDRKRRRQWSPDTGDDVEHDRLRNGQDYWGRTVRQTVDAPQQISLVINVGTPCSVDADDILWRGAVGVILADLLEEAGFRVEVWSIQYHAENYENGMAGFIAARLKASESPVDISALTNALSGWFYRTIMFQAFAVVKGSEHTSYLGYPKKMPRIPTELVNGLGGSSATTVTIDDLWNKHAALIRVREVLAQFAA